ncbi:hypothetical protein Dimus_016262 [Dionaea muscipula]
MAYVISIPAQELPYGDWLTMVFKAFNVPLIDKQGEAPKRRDDEDDVPAENDQNEEVENEEQNNEADFDWETVIDEVEIKREEVQKEAEVEESRSGEKYFDTVDEVRPDEVDIQVPDVLVSAPSSVQRKEKNTAGVDPSIPTGSIPDSLLQHLQAELDRARAHRLQVELDRACAENARLQALLQQTTS